MAQINKAGLGIFGLRNIVYGLLIFGLILGFGCVASATTVYTPEEGSWQTDIYSPVYNTWLGQTAWSDATPYGSQSYLDTIPNPEDLVWNPEETHTELTPAEESRVTSQIAKLNIPFIVNQGQADERVKFYANTFGGTVFITENGAIVYSFLNVEDETAVKGLALKEEFVGGRVGNVKGEGNAITKVSYFKGNDLSKWKSNIPTYELVSLGEVYEGIELKLKAYGNNVEKLFFVEPGAEPERIRAKLSGAKALKVNEAGELEVETELGIVKFTKPEAYQEIGGEKKPVDVAYVVYERNAYDFKVGNYDKKRPLVIDPLLASTFIGGRNNDFGRSIAIDETGNVYVTGSASSNYPTTTGAYDESFNGGNDVFISKLDSSLSSLLASTFIGGCSDDTGYSIAIDETGNVYVTGETNYIDYPTTSGAYDVSFNGDQYAGYYDVFVSKLDSGLSSLLASTFIGGSGFGDHGRSIALDDRGNVYVTGFTFSSDYPTTSGAYDVSHNGNADVFVSKLDSSLSVLLESTLIGGGFADWGASIALDEDENVYVTGYTLYSGYPTTSGAYDVTHNGGYYDGFVSKLDSSLSSLLASTFIGGGDRDFGFSIALDETGNVYVTGYTESSDYPTTSDAYDESFNGGNDVFISELDSSLSSLLASTFIGGGSDDKGYSITLDETGNVYVTGSASSNYPTTAGAYDVSYNDWYPDCHDVFVSKLSGNLPAVPAPNITSFAPPSPVNDTVCYWRTFNVTVNQTVNVNWYLSDLLLFTNISVTEANCTLHAEVAGEHNVSAVATNPKGNDMQEWDWNVKVPVLLVLVHRPNGGEWIPGGSIYDIKWSISAGTYSLATNPITIYYSTDNGGSWTQIATNEPNDGRYSWTVPNTFTSSNCLVKVEAIDDRGNTGDDTSDSVFTITQTTSSESATIPAGGTETVEGPPESDTNVTVTATTGEVTVTVAYYSENPYPEATVPTNMVPKYIDIAVSDKDNVSWPLYVEMHYTDAEIAGFDENTLGFYYLKDGAWHVCSDSGVNVGENYVWANLQESEYTGTPLCAGGGTPIPEFSSVGLILAVLGTLCIVFVTRMRRSGNNR